MSSRENFSPNKKAEVKAGFFAHCLFQKKNDGDGICLPKSKQTVQVKERPFLLFSIIKKIDYFLCESKLFSNFALFRL